MTGYGISNRGLCEAMKKAGVLCATEKGKIGRRWSFWDKRRRSTVAFWLNHTDVVPLYLWARMNQEDRLQFPLHQQQPEDLDSQSVQSA